MAQLQRANERREVEKAAAWERMEAKNNSKGGAQGESFVTGSYLKQLEIQKEGQLITAVEERLNEKKTANAERGMTGFYTNYLSKIRGVNSEAIDADDSGAFEAPEQQETDSRVKTEQADQNGQAAPPKDFRGKMEDKLRELK